MERIDAHQHFWNYDISRHNWITDDMAVIRRDFLPVDLEPLLKENNINGSLAVQADQTEEETRFLLELANEYPFIKGVVGWIDLRSNDIKERLAESEQYKKLKGFRHILQGEPDDRFMLQPDFLNGIEALAEFDYSYDILVFPRHLVHVKKLVDLFPNQRFVIDHIAKPGIRKNEIKEWEKDMREIAHHSNVWCKLSGMVTEADWKQWKKEDIYPYMDVVMESFGSKRVMFGSDWPVCLVAASYSEVKGIVDDYTASLTENEQKGIFGLNAILFYDLKS